jgi:predicted nucleotidyltransferase
MADAQVISKIRKYIYLLNSEGLGNSRAFLFGSFASGTNTESSDIDLMLVSDSLDEKDIGKKSLAWILTKGIDYRIEPYLINLNRFLTDENSPIIQVVKEKGIEIAF